MFIDTNVFVSARSTQAPACAPARAALARALESGEPLRISRQVMREYLSVVTRPQIWSDPLSMAEALDDVARLSAAFEVLEDGPRVMGMLVGLCRNVAVAGKQVHDANIVATMLTHNERQLLTFDGSDFRRYGDRIELIELETTA